MISCYSNIPLKMPLWWLCREWTVEGASGEVNIRSSYSFVYMCYVSFIDLACQGCFRGIILSSLTLAALEVLIPRKGPFT